MVLSKSIYASKNTNISTEVGVSTYMQSQIQISALK